MASLRKIFDKQADLMHRYHPIEAANGFDPGSVPVNIDDRFGQARLKEFAWRFTEEMTEASNQLSASSIENAAYREELSDAAHFLTEFCIYAGISANDIMPHRLDNEIDGLYEKACGSDGDQIIDKSFFTTRGRGRVTKDFVNLTMWHCVREMGSACHLLKNRPWKQSQVNTDRMLFKYHIDQVWLFFIQVCAISGLSPDDLFAGYMGKHAVNRLRQDGGY